MDKVQLSKKLSRLLRHRIKENNLKMDSEGYVKLDDVLKLPGFSGKGITYEQVVDVVDNNDKKRFNLIQKHDVYYIRANQGHSGHVGKMLDDAKMLVPVDITKRKVAYHGTYYSAWKFIKVSGLKPMSRKHVHMAKHVDTKKVISGMRRSCEVVLEVDLVAASKDGIKFYESANGVILTEQNIPIKYITKQ